jgi:zinc/manganese transport system substrate-binding protein
MVVCSGGGLEDKWLPTLLKRSSNLNIRSGAAVLLASNYQAVKLDVKDKEGRSQARPHLNPYNILKVAEEFSKRVQLADPLNRGFYQSSYIDFVKNFSDAIKRWEKSGKALSGMKIIVLNDSWAYLVDWLKLDVALNVEKEKNGRKSNSFLIRELTKKAKDNGAEAIIYADFQVKDDLYAISKKGNIRVIFLPFTAGGMVNTYDLFKVFEKYSKLQIDNNTNRKAYF